MRTLAILLAVLAASSSLAVAAERPNFIVIVADDLGYADLGCFGAFDIETPHIDRMAREGMRLTDFHMASPTCTASRAAMMTGCYPVRVGMGDDIAVRADGSVSPSRVLWPSSPFGLNPDEFTIAEALKAAGYATALVGKWHLGDPPKFNPIRHGFDEFFGVYYSNDMQPYEYYRNEERLPEKIDRDLQTKRCTDEALAFIKRSKDEPFFLFLAHTMPHTPLAASKGFRGKSKRGLYGDAVAEIDWSVGEVIAALRELNLDRQTLVLFTSDNGAWLARGEHGGLNTPYRNGKAHTYEGGMRVPCVAWQPGVVPEGAECGEFATAMDLLPTFARMAGAEVPGDRTIDGKDMGPLLRGEPDAQTPWDRFYYYFGNELHAVRSGRWKLRAQNTLANENIYHRPWRDVDAVVPEALYDLQRDPGEQKSVLGDHPKIAKRLRGYLDEARAELGDALTGVEPSKARPIGEVDR